MINTEVYNGKICHHHMIAPVELLGQTPAFFPFAPLPTIQIIKYDHARKIN
jgi:hypothetical protein